jgi:hypothetical protein
MQNKHLSRPWKYIGGIELFFNSFLTSTLERDEWLASRPAHFIRMERVANAYGMGVWVGLKAGLDVVGKSQNLFSFPRFEPRIVQRIA